MRRAIASSLAATGAFALCGCFNIGVVTGTEIPADRVAQIVPGKTTKDEILRWFGAPYESTDGEVLTRMFDAGEIAAEDARRAAVQRHAGRSRSSRATRRS